MRSWFSCFRWIWPSWTFILLQLQGFCQELWWHFTSLFTLFSCFRGVKRQFILVRLLLRAQFLSRLSPTSGSQCKRNCTSPVLLAAVEKCKIKHVICFLCLSRGLAQCLWNISCKNYVVYESFFNKLFGLNVVLCQYYIHLSWNCVWNKYLNGAFIFPVCLYRKLRCNLKSLLKTKTANQQKHKNSTPKPFQSLEQNKQRKRCQNSLKSDSLDLHLEYKPAISFMHFKWLSPLLPHVTF